MSGKVTVYANIVLYVSGAAIAPGTVLVVEKICEGQYTTLDGFYFGSYELTEM